MITFVQPYTTEKSVKIWVSKGRKSEFDFRVHYQEPNKRKRTPKHIHLAVDLLIKYAFQKELTLRLREHLMNIFLKVKPVKEYPPRLQIFEKSHIEFFKALDDIGDYAVEFILIAAELIMIQEITNRAREIGHEPTQDERKALLAYKVYGRVDKDIFSVISAATYKGKGAIS